MAWSTSELADLAGTTVNTIRHYHRSGLLDEPDRMSNGYKQYRARHLVRLLQIRRLRDLGVPLAQIEAVGVAGGADAGQAAQALLAVDADLAASIERLQRARGEIRAILEGGTATDVPAGFEGIATTMSEADRSLMLVYEQLYDESAMKDLRQMADAEPDDAGAEFDALPADADEATRQRLAEVMGPQIAQHLANFPWLLQPAEHLSKSERVTQETFLETYTELYNEAQLNVLARAAMLANDLIAADADDRNRGGSNG